MVKSHVTNINTAKSPETDDKKYLWHEFTPKDGRRYGDITYADNPE
jgi:hypothetical protein